MFNGQLEMSLGNARGCQNATRRQRRLSRAHWWFQRMRQVVERATDWSPAPPARPEQIWLPGAHRQLDVAPQPARRGARGEEQQVCE